MSIARRVQAVRSRARIRRWEFRQRHHARGAWQRFRTALAMAERAYAIDEATMHRLVELGAIIDHRGRSLEPPRQIVWITPELASTLGGSALAMRLDATMLASQWLALVPFAGLDPAPSTS